MTHDIIKLAGEAGMSASTIHTPAMTQFLERFAQLAAAAERESLCAYFKDLEDKAESVRDKMYLSGVQFVIRARGQQ